MYPDPALGVTEAAGGALDGTTGTLTSAGLTAFPQLKGPVPVGTGSYGYGYGATVSSGAPYTPFLTNSAGNTMAGVYQHPGTDPQARVSELALNFATTPARRSGCCWPRAHQLGHQQHPPGLVPQLLRPGHRRRLHRRQRVELPVPVHARGHRPARLQLPGR